jgi:hypothetical protein
VFEALAGDDVEEDEEGKLQWHGRVRADAQQISAILASADSCRLCGTGLFLSPISEMNVGRQCAV